MADLVRCQPARVLQENVTAAGWVGTTTCPADLLKPCATQQFLNHCIRPCIRLQPRVESVFGECLVGAWPAGDFIAGVGDLERVAKLYKQILRKAHAHHTTHSQTYIEPVACLHSLIESAAAMHSV